MKTKQEHQVGTKIHCKLFAILSAKVDNLMSFKTEMRVDH